MNNKDQIAASMTQVAAIELAMAAVEHKLERKDLYLICRYAEDFCAGREQGRINSDNLAHGFARFMAEREVGATNAQIASLETLVKVAQENYDVALHREEKCDVEQAQVHAALNKARRQAAYTLRELRDRLQAAKDAAGK